MTALFVRTTCAATLEPVIVTGTAASKVGDVEHSEFTGSHVYLGPDALARENNSLAELIAHESGVQFRQSGGTGSYSSITVRGATAAQTNVYFDGILLNNMSNGGVDLSQLELLNLGSIDIYRGATPIQLGAGSIGGAVNLNSRKAQGNASRILIGAGSFNERKLQLSRQFLQGDWDATFAASHHRADNGFDFLNENGTPLNPQDDRMERRQNAEFVRSTALIKAGKQFSESVRYDASLQYSDREQGVSHWRNRPDTQATFDTDTLQLQLNRRSTADERAIWSHTQGVFLNHNIERYDDSLSQIGLGAQNTRTATLVVGGRSYWEAISDRGTLAFNIDLRNESMEQQDRLSGERYTAVRDGINGAAQYSLFRFNERLLITPSLRLQSISDKYNGVLRETKNSRSNTKITPQLGARWRISDTLELTGNVGQHHREPVFFELFGDRGLYIGNDRLVAEEGINLDAGAQWQSQRNSARRLGISAFASFRDELIVSVYDARGIGRSENSGKAKILGVEGSAVWQWNKRWQTRLNVTVQSAENQSTSNAFTGKQLPGEAQLVSFATVKYQAGPWSAWYESDLVNGRYYDTANLLAAEDQLVHNIGIGFKQKRIETTLLLKNISDQTTEDFNGFPKPGKSIHFTFIYSFDGDHT